MARIKKNRFRRSFLSRFGLFLMLSLLFEAAFSAYSSLSSGEENNGLLANESLEPVVGEASEALIAGLDYNPPVNELRELGVGAFNEVSSPAYVPLDYGLVAYWDGSGENGKSYDISGNGYAAALGGTAFFSRASKLNGVYIDSKPASAQAGGTWTKSDDGVFDAVGDGNKAFALSFWYRTSSAEVEDQIVNFVGANYSDVTHSPFIIMSGNFGGGTWFWRGYASERNNIDMGPYADGKWHNVVLTENSVGAYGYVDGKPVGPSPLSGGGFDYSTGWNMTFGCRQTLQDNNSQCDPLAFSPNHGYMADLGIDEIAFWNRSFTANDVAMLYYNGTNGTFCAGNPCSFSRNKNLAYKFK